MMLLRQELREPSVYFAILNAIAAWRTTPKAMAENVGMAVISMPKYLKTLESIGLVKRSGPANGGVRIRWPRNRRISTL